MAYCFMIFLLQMALLIISLRSLNNGSKHEETAGEKPFDVNKQFELFVVQFICIVILHIQLEGEFQQGIKFINFVLYSKDLKGHYTVEVLVIAIM